MNLSRRKIIEVPAAALGALFASRFSSAQATRTTFQPIRVATGLLATWQSTAWLGAEAGVFKQRGIDLTVPAIAVGGPEAAAGLLRGDWEFAHTGSVPVAEEVLKGGDIVIIAMPTSDFPKSFVMTRKEITELSQLDGKKVGVLTETGQTSTAARITVQKAGASATYLPLIKFDRSMLHWPLGRSTLAHCRSTCVLPAKFATAGTRFPWIPLMRRLYLRRHENSLLPTAPLSWK